MQINVGTPTMKLLGCSGMMAVETGMCGLVRRLLIGCLLLLSGRLYCCSSERKSRGERIISQLIPTLPILHHSLPQLLIYRRVNFFSLCPFSFGYKLHVSPPPLPDSPALSLDNSTGIEHVTEGVSGSALAVKFPGEGVGTFFPNGYRKHQGAELTLLSSLLKT